MALTPSSFIFFPKNHDRYTATTDYTHQPCAIFTVHYVVQLCNDSMDIIGPLVVHEHLSVGLITALRFKDTPRVLGDDDTSNDAGESTVQVDGRAMSSASPPTPVGHVTSTLDLLGTLRNAPRRAQGSQGRHYRGRILQGGLHCV